MPKQGPGGIRFSFLWVGFTVMSAFCFGQSPQIDSLNREIQKASGERYYSHSNALAEWYLNLDNTKARQTTQLPINSAEMHQFPAGRAEAYRLKGLALTMNGSYMEALGALDTSISVSRAISLQHLVAKGLIAKGDKDALAAWHTKLRAKLPDLRVVGGCCGTDSTHVAAICQELAPQ